MNCQRQWYEIWSIKMRGRDEDEDKGVKNGYSSEVHSIGMLLHETFQNSNISQVRAKIFKY